MKKWNMYSLSAYRFGMTLEELSYMELLVDGWNDDENYATDVETIATRSGMVSERLRFLRFRSIQISRRH